MSDGGLDALLDRIAVVDVVAAFCHRIDDHDIAGLTAVFTDDVFTDYGPTRGGPVHGLAAVLARIGRGQSEFRRTQHQLGQSEVVLDGDRAEVCTYVTATHEHWDGAISRVHLRYLDVVVRTPAGWRIRRRVAEACVVDGLPRDGWQYVDRQAPPA